jgi:hypothetical protein
LEESSKKRELRLDKAFERLKGVKDKDIDEIIAKVDDLFANLDISSSLNGVSVVSAKELLEIYEKNFTLENLSLKGIISAEVKRLLEEIEATILSTRNKIRECIECERIHDAKMERLAIATLKRKEKWCEFEKMIRKKLRELIFTYETSLEREFQNYFERAKHHRNPEKAEAVILSTGKWSRKHLLSSYKSVVEKFDELSIKVVNEFQYSGEMNKYFEIKNPIRKSAEECKGKLMETKLVFRDQMGKLKVRTNCGENEGERKRFINLLADQCFSIKELGNCFTLLSEAWQVSSKEMDNSSKVLINETILNSIEDQFKLLLKTFESQSDIRQSIFKKMETELEKIETFGIESSGFDAHAYSSTTQFFVCKNILCDEGKLII